MINHLVEGLELLAVVVRASKVHLMIGKLVTPISGDKTLGVDQVEAGAGLVFRHALTHEKCNNLLGHTDTSTSSTKEDGAVLLAGKSRTLHGVDDTAEDDSTRTLDVIVEACVGITIPLQSGEGILEVLKLNDDTVDLR